jgi:uncharacterized protein (DUF58 family)
MPSRSGSRLGLHKVVADRFRESLTARGRYLFALTAALALLGLHPKGNQVFKVFAVPASMLVVASTFALSRRPRISLDCSLPERATAGTPLNIPYAITGRERVRPLLLSFPASRGIELAPRQALIASRGDEPTRGQVTLRAERRGKYHLRGPTVRATDPLGLVGGRALESTPRNLLVYPRFYAMDSFGLPVGRRYQPGGIPLASRTGDSLEFLGTREYRPGDPIKHIHWRSSARVGAPVVMEFQEEYFSRIALVLDTFLPRRPKPAERDAFEASISVIASVTDYFSRSEYVVDIFAAGPDLYEVSAGRSLAYLENVLDVLACVEPCHDPPFSIVGPTLFEKLQQITSVVAVVQDWDDAREDLLRRVKAFGVDLRTIIVRDGPTRKDFGAAADELGEVSLIRPGDVEEALASEGRP